jgi:3-(3-hydroxy-phenyl)propionate hydroxylase
MGQGLCAGIRDVANLAWKLIACLMGRNHEALLASYQSERKPHATDYIETAARMGALVNEMEAGAKTLFGDETEDGAVRMKSIKRPLGPGLGHPSDKNRGTLFPQFTLRNGERLDDHVGHEFFLAIDGKRSSVGGDIAFRHILSTEDEPDLKPVLSAIDAKAVVVRPDKHILVSAKAVKEIDMLVGYALRDFI